MTNQHADHPTTEDQLDFEVFATSLTSRCLQINQKSDAIAIGIYGAWGSGKSSLLKMISKDLKKHNLMPIEFMAWKYEKEDDLRAALIQTILHQAKVNASWYKRPMIRFRIWFSRLNFLSGTWELAKRIIPFFLRLTFVVLSATIVLGWTSKELKHELDKLANTFGFSIGTNPYLPNVIRAIVGFAGVIAANPIEIFKLFSAELGIDFSRMSKANTFRDRVVFLDEFTTEFSKIVELIGQGKPLVIIIDDLDRCLPNKALEILEVIKLHLDVPGCVFLIAVDREVIEPAVALKYKDVFELPSYSKENFEDIGAFRGDDYLEKIIHLPFSLPPLSAEQIKSFVQFLCEDFPEDGSTLVFEEGVPGNPRKIKRILQSFRFVREMAAAHIASQNLQMSLIAKLVIIQYRFRPLYRSIVSEPKLLEKIEEYYHDELVDTEAPSSIQTHAQSLAEEYRELRPILGNRRHAGDTFVGVDATPYVFLLQTVSESLAEPASVDESIGDFESMIRQLNRRILSESQQVLNTFVMPDIGEKEEVSDQERLPAIQLLSSSANTILVGSVGSGKSTLLRYLATNKISSMEKPEIVLFVSFSNFRRTELADQSGPMLLINYFCRQYSDWNVQLAPEFLLDQLEIGRCLLLLDGYDEVSDEDRQLLTPAVRDFASRYPGNQVIIATRKSSTRELLSSLGATFQMRWLQPLTEEQVKKVIRNRVPDLADEVQRFVSQNSELKDLAKQPNRLDLIVRNSSTIASGRSFGRLVLDDIVQAVQRASKEHDLLITDALSDLAFMSINAGADRLDYGEFRRYFDKEAYLDLNMRDEVIGIISEKLDFVRVDHVAFSFGHKAYQSALAAYRISRDTLPLREIIEKRLKEYSWRQPITFAFEFLCESRPSDADQLTRELVSSTDLDRVQLAASFIPILGKANTTSETAEAVRKVLSNESIPDDLRLVYIDLVKEMP